MEDKMGLTKKSITISEELFKEAQTVSENFSALVAEALRTYLEKQKIQKALESFGSWEDRKKKSVDMVNEMRSEKGRNYAGRNS
jgi:post-segregation antitoxin (ccd killing protein)